MQPTPPWVPIVLTAVTAFGILMQAVILVAILLAVKRTLNKANELMKTAEGHAMPILATTRKLVDETAPKVKVVVQNVTDITEKLKSQTTHVNQTVDDLLKKTEGQADRVDEMITGTLNSIAHATATMQKVVSTPVRQVGAVLTGLRVGFGVLRSKEQEPRTEPDGNHFV